VTPWRPDCNLSAHFPGSAAVADRAGPRLGQELDNDSWKGAPSMAATNINRVVMTGNLTRDPELRSTSGGM